MLPSPLRPFLLTYLRHFYDVRSYASFSYSLIHLLKFISRPGCLTRGTAQVFTYLMRFLIHSLISSSLLVLQRYFFFFKFLSSPLVWWSLLPKFPNTCKFPVRCRSIFLISEICCFSHSSFSSSHNNYYYYFLRVFPTSINWWSNRIQLLYLDRQEILI